MQAASTEVTWSSFVIDAGGAARVLRLHRAAILGSRRAAIDEVRRQEVAQLRRDGYEPALTSSRWCLLKRPENLTDKRICAGRDKPAIQRGVEAWDCTLRPARQAPAGHRPGLGRNAPTENGCGAAIGPTTRRPSHATTSPAAAAGSPCG
jgi:hypothetical protein